MVAAVAMVACAAPSLSQRPVMPLVIEHGEIPAPPEPVRPVLRQLYINDDLKALNFDGVDDSVKLCIPEGDDVATCVYFVEFRKWLQSLKRT
jgi:hypothetical protein